MCMMSTPRKRRHDTEGSNYGKRSSSEADDLPSVDQVLLGLELPTCEESDQSESELTGIEVSQSDILLGETTKQLNFLIRDESNQSEPRNQNDSAISACDLNVSELFKFQSKVLRTTDAVDDSCAVTEDSCDSSFNVVSSQPDILFGKELREQYSFSSREDANGSQISKAATEMDDDSNQFAEKLDTSHQSVNSFDVDHLIGNDYLVTVDQRDTSRGSNDLNKSEVTHMPGFDDGHETETEDANPNDELDKTSQSGDNVNFAERVFRHGLLETSSIELPKYSTPMKESTPDVAVTYLPAFNLNDQESDVSSIASSESSEASEIEDDDDVRDFVEDISDDEFPALGLVIRESEGSILNESQPDVSGILDAELTNYLTKASLFNSLKIYKDHTLSVNEVILRLMNLYVKNKESKAGLQRIVTFLCSLLPESHNLPTSAHSMFEYIVSLAPPEPVVLHYYCKRCLFYHGVNNLGDCEVCHSSTEFGRFYIFDIASLIKFFFESRNLASIMESEENKNVNYTGLRNVKDGEVYKSINVNRGKFDVTIIFGSDGVRIRKGGKELWLAVFTIAEVPIHLQSSFLTVIGVWYDEQKPNMHTFLKPFAEKMETLDKGSETGVEWTHPSSKEVHRSRVRFLVAVLDAPARAITQNVMQFSSSYGCNLCETKAKRTEYVVNKKRVRRFFYVDKPKLRTKERMLKHAASKGDAKHFKGVRGPSALSIIPSFDVAKCIVPEYMHSVLLGVTSQLLHIWTSKDGKWSLKNRISEIDAVLKDLKHPSFVHRTSRQLQKLQYWKASDYYYFLLFEAVPTLTGFLPQRYLQHLMLLVKAIWMLLRHTITDPQIDEAHLLLKLFVNDFGKLYGNRELVSNVHQLLHLCLCVKRFGGLHCFSAFPFEDLNSLVANSTHGTNNVDAEIVLNIKICQGIHILKNIVQGCDDPNCFSNTFSEGELLGAEVSSCPASVELSTLFPACDSPKLYSRAKLGYDVFTSEIHKKLASEDFFAMWTENGVAKFGSIICFVEACPNKFVVLRLFSVDQTRALYHRETLKCLEHFVPVEASNVHVMSFSDIVPSIVKVGKIKEFIYQRPNLYRSVM